MRQRLQLRQAFSYLRGLLLGRVTLDNANADLRGVFSSRAGYEIRRQIRVGLCVNPTFPSIHQNLISINITKYPHDPARLLAAINDQVAAWLKKNQRAD